MDITIRPTEQLSTINGVLARVWVGTTDRGVEVQLLVTRVAVHESEDQSAFMAELTSQLAPAPETPAFPLRMVL